MKKEDLHTKKIIPGFTTAEVLLSTSVFAIMVVGLAGAFSYVVQATATSTITSRAQYIANEGLEAVRNIRDASYANLVDGTYGLNISGNNWTLSGSSDVSDIFTRQINISTIDSTTKEIKSTVTWSTAQQTGVDSIVQTMRLTNWNRTVFLIGNWAAASIESSLNPTGSQTITDVELSGNYAYAIRNSTTTNFVAFNVSSTTTPTIAGSTTISPTAVDMAISGTYAYAVGTSDTQELTVVNISNPLLPITLSSLNLAGTQDARAITISGNYAYITRVQSTNPELYIVNISNPLIPVLSGSLDLAQSPNQIYVSGSYAYIASTNNAQELEVINISNPAAPTVAAVLGLSTNDDAVSITGSGTQVVIGRTTGELNVISVATPTAPVLLGSFATGGSVNKIALGNTGTYAFIATSNTAQEFQVINISAPATISRVGFLNLSGNLFGIAYNSVADRAFGGGVEANPEFIILKPN
jgi:hypothetical protein